MNKLIFTGILILLSFTFFCNEEESKIQIVNAVCISENIHSTFWTTPPTEDIHVFYNFFIYYKTDIKEPDVQRAVVQLPDGNSLQLNLINYQESVIGGWNRINYPFKQDSLPIGQFQAEIVLRDGDSDSYSGMINAPGQIGTNGFSYVFSEDTDIFSGATPILKRAEYPSGTKDSTTITITFTADDDNVYNGTIWFFVASGEYAAKSSMYFKDPETGEPTSIIDGLVTDGLTSNTVTLQNTDIDYANGVTFDQLTSFAVILIDGAQYIDQEIFDKFDYQSISAKTALNK